VHLHLRNLFAKLGLGGRVELAADAIKAGLGQGRTSY